MILLAVNLRISYYKKYMYSAAPLHYSSESVLLESWHETIKWNNKSLFG